MRKKRTFTGEFNKEAVALVHQPGMTVTKVAKDLDLTPSALAKWVKKATGSDAVTITNPNESSVDQLKRQCQELQKQNRLLTMERDILKKAATFFAKESE